MSSAFDRVTRLSEAVGQPYVTARGGAGDLEASTTAIVDALLGRLARVSAVLGDREGAGDVDRFAERLLLSDLALTSGALRALDAAAAGRLAQAATELEQARAAFERADPFPLESEPT